jgi:hypothetical protein
MTLTPPLAGDESARCRDRWLLDGGLPSRPKGCCLKCGQIAAVERAGASQNCTVGAQCLHHSVAEGSFIFHGTPYL